MDHIAGPKARLRASQVNDYRAGVAAGHAIPPSAAPPTMTQSTSLSRFLRPALGIPYPALLIRRGYRHKTVTSIC
jgi:hypothetical protein